MSKRHELTSNGTASKTWYHRSDRAGEDVKLKDNRMMINAIIWVLKTGVPWRDLPERFGSWNSVYSRFYRWCKRGVWEKIFLELSKDQDNEEYMIDGSYVRVHQHGAGGKGGPKNKESAVPGEEIPPKSMP